MPAPKGNCNAIDYGDIMVIYAEFFGPETPRISEGIFLCSPLRRREFFSAWERKHGAESLDRLKSSARSWWRIHRKGR